MLGSFHRTRLTLARSAEFRIPAEHLNALDVAPPLQVGPAARHFASQSSSVEEHEPRQDPQARGPPITRRDAAVQHPTHEFVPIPKDLRNYRTVASIPGLSREEQASVYVSGTLLFTMRV